MKLGVFKPSIFKSWAVLFALVSPLAFGGFISGELSAARRKWSDRSGGFSINAELINFKNGKVYLEKADGEVVGVPIEKLSYADYDYLRTVPEMQRFLRDNPLPTEHVVFETEFDRGFMSLSFSPDGRFMAGATHKGVFLLDIKYKSHKLLISAGGQLRSYFYFAKFSPDGKTLVAHSFISKKATVWEVDSDGSLGQAHTFPAPHMHRVMSMSFDRDGEHVISGDELSNVCYWNLKTGEVEHTFVNMFRGSVEGCFINAKGTQAVCTNGQFAILLDLQLGKPIQKMKLTNTHVYRTDMSGDGRRVFAEANQTVYGWTTLDGKERLQFKPQGKGPVWKLVSTKDGNFLLVGRNGTADLWNTATEKHIHTYHTSGGAYSKVMAISNDNKLIAIASGPSDRHLQIFRNPAAP